MLNKVNERDSLEAIKRLIILHNDCTIDRWYTPEQIN